MLIKEYRIPLPLTVDEYKIAQLYMIAKKSREESKGAGSGVEILVNEPYQDGPGPAGTGQYTHKIYHVGSHLPGWMKSLMPKSALIVEEEAWNAYPYTKTKYKCPFVERFTLEIETYYFDDDGSQENVFGLSKSELRERTVDVIDIVKDQSVEYVPEEDPRTFVAEKTGRGPLVDTWIEDYWKECKGRPTPLKDGKALMCAYKLCRVEFKYWGMQTKIERFIDDVALRKTMVHAHRQAWVWQDEWWGLTIEDVRQIERETQEALAAKMAAVSSAEADADAVDPTDGDGGKSGGSAPQTPTTDGGVPGAARGVVVVDGEPSGAANGDGRQQAKLAPHASADRRPSRGTKNLEDDLLTARMESIAHDSDQGSENSDEFYDAKDEFHETLSLTKWSSMELVAEGQPQSAGCLDPNDAFRLFPTDLGAKYERQLSSRSADSYLSGSNASPMPPTCPTLCLLLVFHGGSVLDANADLSGKNADVTTFRESFESVIRQHYPCLNGRVAIRLVPCPAICSEALGIFSSLSPYSFDVSPTAADGDVQVTRDAIPIGAVPLFMTSSSDYLDALSRVIAKANSVYYEFSKSEEGAGFMGQVAVIADSVGSIFAYDALSSYFGNLSHARHGAKFNSLSSENLERAGAGGAHGSPGLDVHQSGGGAEPPGDGQGGPRKKFSGSHLGDGVLVPGDASLGVGDHTPLKAFLSAPTQRSLSISSCGSEAGLLDFQVADLFMMGSPLSIILSFRKLRSLDDKNALPPRPACGQVFNFFHPANPVASRIEPLLCPSFSQLPPLPIPRYSKYPMGDGAPTNLLEYLQRRPFILASVPGGSASNNADGSRQSGAASASRSRRISESWVFPASGASAGAPDVASINTIAAVSQKWWGNKRIDYALYCPEGIANFPTIALPHLFHASYWESHDVVAFILRQLMHYDPCPDSEDERETACSSRDQPREKWTKKRTSVKIKNCSANHRGNDVIVGEGMPQVLTAKFAYGPLDVVALTGEKVDVHAMPDTSVGEWILLGTETTDKGGRVRFRVPDDKAFGDGFYPVKMVVRGDQSCAELSLAVVPKETECVVFSIDGSFTASVSVTAKDPKVRPGAVDVVRHWQELGYLIIYITGRPDIQQRRVISWLSQHNFPHGLISFADGVSTEFLTHKAQYLSRLVKDVGLIIHAAYGSSKDIVVYQSLGLSPDRIYIVGKVSKKHVSSCNNISEGYAVHLNDLMTPSGCRPAQGNARILMPRGFFSLPGQTARPLGRSRSVRRTPSLRGSQATSTSPAQQSPKSRSILRIRT